MGKIRLKHYKQRKASNNAVVQRKILPHLQDAHFTARQLYASQSGEHAYQGIDYIDDAVAEMPLDVRKDPGVKQAVRDAKSMFNARRGGRPAFDAIMEIGNAVARYYKR